VSSLMTSSNKFFVHVAILGMVAGIWTFGIAKEST